MTRCDCGSQVLFNDWVLTGDGVLHQADFCGCHKCERVTNPPDMCDLCGMCIDCCTCVTAVFHCVCGRETFTKGGRVAWHTHKHNSSVTCMASNMIIKEQV